MERKISFRLLNFSHTIFEVLLRILVISRLFRACVRFADSTYNTLQMQKIRKKNYRINIKGRKKGIKKGFKIID